MIEVYFIIYLTLLFSLFQKINIEKLAPKSTKFHEKFLESKRKTNEKIEKPLFKMKMFEGVESKVKENLKKFKKNPINPGRSYNNLDNLIAKIENELQELNN